MVATGDAAPIIEKKDEELRQLRAELESKQKEINSLNEETSRLKSQLAQVRKRETPDVVEIPDTPQQEKELSKRAERQKANRLASGVGPAKRDGGFEIKVRGDKNYEEVYFEPAFDDSHAQRKRKRVESPKADKKEDSLSQLMDFMDQKSKEMQSGVNKALGGQKKQPDLMDELFSDTKTKASEKNPAPEEKKEKSPARRLPDSSAIHQKKETQEVRVCKKKSERSQLKGIVCKECQAVSPNSTCGDD